MVETNKNIVELFPLDIDNYNLSTDIPIIIDEFWTSKQRQGNSLHEISYRACFKPQLPNYFIKKYTNEGDIVYDPFTGRGTTIIEAALMNRNVISNDINPLSRILCESRLYIPNIKDIENRIDSVKITSGIECDLDLLHFYHQDTLNEILSFRNYFISKSKKNEIDYIDKWLQMIISNRLTGHSKGFLSIYTLPPNQAVSIERQKKINKQRNQKPEYRNLKEIVLKKTKQLIKDINNEHITNLNTVRINSLFLTKDARNTPEIEDNSVKLTVTSPPFLDVIKYDDDNWLRCWFNNIDSKEIGKNITMSKKLEDWNNVMSDVLKELYRITQPNGYVAFEVGEIKNGKIKLEQEILKLALNNSFFCECILINQQNFTKTSNIWGIKNNSTGTNTNRIVVLKK